MVKKGAKKRIVIKPGFLSQIPMPSTPALRELAKRENLKLLDSMTRKGGKRRKLEQLGAEFIGRQRKNISVRNTSTFYLNLFLALYGGKIIRDNSAPLFPEPDIDISWDSYFYPDVLVAGEKRVSFGEVKAISVNGAKPFFGYRQMAGYWRNLLENRGSEMFAAIFKYGNWRPVKYHICHNEDDHKCDNRCLVRNLSKTTRSLLVIPNNLLTFLLMLSPSQEMDQRKTRRGNGRETYKKPYGTWLTCLHKNYDNPKKAIDEILKHADSKHLGLMYFSKKDFFLDDLKVKKTTSPDNLYCRSKRGFPMYKIKSFDIVKYDTLHHDAWIRHFKDKLDDFLDCLGIKELYKERAERASIISVETKYIPEKPADGIPI